MSESQNDAPSREVAYRAFAAEFNDATHTFQESDDDRAPVYALLPTGEKANRVFIVGTLTETNNVGSEEEYWQGRVVDPTATIFTYAGQYQSEAAAFLRGAEPPAFVAIVGKPRTYETDDGMVNVSLRPESITAVDEGTRHRWVSETADRTLERIKAFDDESNPYARMAKEQYGGNVEQYRQHVIEALETLDETPQDDETPSQSASGSPPTSSESETDSEAMFDDSSETTSPSSSSERLETDSGPDGTPGDFETDI